MSGYILLQDQICWYLAIPGYLLHCLPSLTFSAFLRLSLTIWLSLTISEYIWQPLNISDYIGIHLFINSYLWLFMSILAIFCYLWQSMTISYYPLLSLSLAIFDHFWSFLVITASYFKFQTFWWMNDLINIARYRGAFAPKNGIFCGTYS